MIQSTVYSLTATPTVIFTGNGATNVYVHASTGASLIGGSDLSAGNGYQIDNGEKINFQTHEAAVYAMSNGSSSTLKVLVISK